MDGVPLVCGRCQVGFSVCRRCWCGQRYCSDECSKAAKDHSHRISQAKYATTEKGKASHRRRQRRYRLRKTREKQKRETDSAQLSDREIEKLKTEHFDEVRFAEWALRQLKTAKAQGKALSLADIVKLDKETGQKAK